MIIKTTICSTLLISFAFLSAALIAPSTVSAAEACKYGSTQARVQENTSKPWTQALTLKCQNSFKVGSFHNETGKFANDTQITVSFPDGSEKKYVWWRGNGAEIAATQNGTYSVKVTTIGYEGTACEQAATVVRDCQGGEPEPSLIPNPQPLPSPLPQPGQCRYSSTQARVQKDIEHDWQEHLSLNCGESFRVGGFHDHTGQFSQDVKLTVQASFDLPLAGVVRYQKTFKNGDSLKTFAYPGTYQLQVTTPDRGGSACQDTANITVSCASWFDWLNGWNRVN